MLHKNKNELQALCKRYQLNISGTKADLIERLGGIVWNAGSHAAPELYLTVAGYCRFSRDAVELALTHYGNFQAVHVGKMAKTNAGKALRYVPVIEMRLNGKLQLIGGLRELEAFIYDHNFDPKPATIDIQRNVWESVLLGS